MKTQIVDGFAGVPVVFIWAAQFTEQAEAIEHAWASLLMGQEVQAEQSVDGQSWIVRTTKGGGK